MYVDHAVQEKVGGQVRSAAWLAVAVRVVCPLCLFTPLQALCLWHLQKHPQRHLAFQVCSVLAC
jgi:hypothetical protein